MNNIICNIFGHKISSEKSYQRYFRATSGAIDGINRHHINLYCDCDRCEKSIKFGQIHGTEEGRILSKK